MESNVSITPQFLLIFILCNSKTIGKGRENVSPLLKSIDLKLPGYLSTRCAKVV